MTTPDLYNPNLPLLSKMGIDHTSFQPEAMPFSAASPWNWAW